MKAGANPLSSDDGDRKPAAKATNYGKKNPAAMSKKKPVAKFASQAATKPASKLTPKPAPAAKRPPMTGGPYSKTKNDYSKMMRSIADPLHACNYGASSIQMR
jgi:hypothetical protein